MLGGLAKGVASAFEAGRDGPTSLSDNFGNIVELTEAACEEIKRRHATGQFGADVVVRIEPDSNVPTHVLVAFDFPLADGRDWIGESHGIPIVIDRRVAPELWGCRIDVCDGAFVRS